MSEISLIAAVDEAGGIGANNQLLTYLPADLKYFKSTTLHKPIIMGRKTYESIGKPLPERKNIVISSRLTESSGVTVVPSLKQALLLTQDMPEVMVIGGAQLYAEAIHYATRLYITRIHHRFKADTFFPTIDSAIWKCTQQEMQKHDDKNQYDMTFCLYERK
jgi:dihydrofolate reductase